MECKTTWFFFILLKLCNLAAAWDICQITALSITYAFKDNVCFAFSQFIQLYPVISQHVFCRLNPRVLYTVVEEELPAQKSMWMCSCVYIQCKFFIGFMGYYISFVTTQNVQTLKCYSNRHIRGLKSLAGVVNDQQLIETELVWEECESNSSCLPHWSLDSHTICSSYSTLFTTHTAEDDKASKIRYFY